MGFVGKVMDGVNGIHIYYIIGIFIFITLFLVILIRTIRIPKKNLQDYKNAILDDNDEVELNEYNK